MQVIATLLTSLLSITLSTTIRVDGEVTPCFIPLPELAFIKSIGTRTVSATPSPSGESTDILSFSEELPTSTEEEGSSTQKAWSAEGSSYDSIITPISTSSESIEEASTSMQFSASNESVSEIKTSVGDPIASEGITPITSGADGETNTTPTSVPTEYVMICIPYCAALDENDRCVSIKGCGYPDRGNFGRHGCCPPGHYSEREVVALITLTALIIAMIYCARG